MTSGENVENKQDKRSESDNVHYDQWPVCGGNCDDDGVVFDVRCPVHSTPSLLAEWRAMFCHASAQSPANQPTHIDPHASPISTPQVNHTPSRGIQDDDC